MALRTQGFQLSALPQAPAIPGNVGVVDAQGIYNALVKGLQVGDALRTAAPRQRFELAQLSTGTKQQEAEAKKLPFTTAADISTANRTTALQSPDIVGTERNKVLSGLSADVSENQNRGTLAQTVAGLPKGQQLIFAKTGLLPTTNTTTTARTPAGTVESTSERTVNVGDTPVTLDSSKTVSPGGVQVTPLTGANGLPLGNVVQTVEPGGKLNTNIAAAPIAALNSVNAGTTYQKVGERVDPETGAKKDVYQAFTQSAIGQPVPHGAPIETAAGSGPPGTAGAGGTATPVLSKNSLKAIDDVQGEIQTLSQRKLELENIANASDQLIKSQLGAGRVAGPIASFLGLAPAQEFVGSVQNALQTALQPLRGTGRVSNTEFNQALSALPKITDQPETIKAKLQYLNLATDWALARQQSYLDSLGSGLNTYQAFRAAQKATPIPEVPNFYAGETTAPAAAPTAAPTAPSFATEQEAEAAAAAGKIKSGDKVLIGGVSGTWQ